MAPAQPPKSGQSPQEDERQGKKEGDQAGEGVHFAETLVNFNMPPQGGPLERLASTPSPANPLTTTPKPTGAASEPVHDLPGGKSPAGGGLFGSFSSQAETRKLPEKLGRYRILKKIGEGGMGAVYLAEDVQLERKVALKVPHFSAMDGSDLLPRFYREAKLAATFNHPNVCQVHEVGEQDGFHYLAMAYIEGRPLTDFIKSGKLQPIKQIVQVVRKVALAMEQAHQQGIIHRDLKPANIMIDKRGEPIVMDFGLARRSGGKEAALTRAGTLVGSPAYMSPEQVTADSKNIGPATDIYSLGVIFYELLTGQKPFQQQGNQIYIQIMTMAPVPPSKLRAEVDPPLDAMVLRAMAKTASERFPSMGKFAEVLADYLRGLQMAKFSGGYGAVKPETGNPLLDSAQTLEIDEASDEGKGSKGPRTPVPAVVSDFSAIQGRQNVEPAGEAAPRWKSPADQEGRWKHLPDAAAQEKSGSRREVRISLDLLIGFVIGAVAVIITLLGFVFFR